MTHSPLLKGIRGSILTYKADPFLTDNKTDCYDYLADGLIVIADGKIEAVGEYADIAGRYPGIAETERYEDALIMPGFIDCHVHYVQTGMTASYGDRLLDWLNRYTFPTEERFADRGYAEEVARRFFDAILSHGTTTANVFCTTYPVSVDTFFEESERRGTRMIAGKVLQDRNVPEALRDASPEESVRQAEELLLKWHGRGRQLYAVIPRFAPTCSPEQLRLAGELYRKYRDRGVYLHTHLDEAEPEIKWVHELFPEAESYTDVYRRYGLTADRSVFAHCCIVTEKEWQTLHDCGCGVAHCPCSNLFLGGGQFKWWEAKKRLRPVRTGMGTDVAGGATFSIPRNLGEAYNVGMLRARSLDALHGWYLATRGGAEALRLEDKIGSIAQGYEADLAVVNLRPDDYTSWRMEGTEDIFEKLFILQTLAPDNLVKATYVAGRKVYGD